MSGSGVTTGMNQATIVLLRQTIQQALLQAVLIVVSFTAAVGAAMRTTAGWRTASTTTRTFGTAVAGFALSWT